MTPTEVLKQYAHRIQLAAPKEWDGFLECFDAYATSVTVAVIHAEQHEVLPKQGRAQLAIHLLNAFRTCHLPTPQAQQPPQP